MPRPHSQKVAGESRTAAINKAMSFSPSEFLKFYYSKGRENEVQYPRLLNPIAIGLLIL
ncbi:hypothetical protein [Daejeonella sp. H1SJ63]|uniref:hypothetical protein n=1 Tax=Daejeonella sp. H1SJ63 TaxID=3034145 RepID=UPI0023EC42EC|nr:hypothetical protein [Daejeonella sp. H1SJ63]